MGDRPPGLIALVARAERRGQGRSRHESRQHCARLRGGQRLHGRGARPLGRPVPGGDRGARRLEIKAPVRRRNCIAQRVAIRLSITSAIEHRSRGSTPSIFVADACASKSITALEDAARLTPPRRQASPSSCPPRPSGSRTHTRPPVPPVVMYAFQPSCMKSRRGQRWPLPSRGRAPSRHASRSRADPPDGPA